MKETFIPIVIGDLGTIPEGLFKVLENLEIRGRMDPSKLRYWGQSEFWEDSWRLEETCCHSFSSERPSANAVVKNSQGVNNYNNNNNNNRKSG